VLFDVQHSGSYGRSVYAHDSMTSLYNQTQSVKRHHDMNSSLCSPEKKRRKMIAPERNMRVKQKNSKSNCCDLAIQSVSDFCK